MKTMSAKSIKDLEAGGSGNLLQRRVHKEYHHVWTG